MIYITHSYEFILIIFGRHEIPMEYFSTDAQGGEQRVLAVSALACLT